MAYDLASIVGTGYKTGAEIGQDITRGNALEVAMQQTPDTTDQDTGQSTKDMFQVQSLAAQLTARAGNSRASDYFTKQAQDFKGAALDNQLKELKVREAHHDEFDRVLGTLKSGDDLVNAAMTSKDLSEPERLRLVSLGQQAKTPEQWKALQTNLEQHSKVGREAAKAQREALQFERGSWAEQEQARHNRVSESNQARATNESIKDRRSREATQQVGNLRDDIRKANTAYEDAQHKIRSEGKKGAPMTPDQERRLKQLETQHNLELDDLQTQYESAKERAAGGSSKSTKQEEPSTSKQSTKVTVDDVQDQDRASLLKDPSEKRKQAFDKAYNSPGLADKVVEESKGKSETKQTDKEDEDKPPVRKVVKDRPMEQQSLDNLYKRELAEYERNKKLKDSKKELAAFEKKASEAGWDLWGQEGYELTFKNRKTGEVLKQSELKL